VSEESKIKEEIGWYKTVFVVLTAIDVSLLAWFAQNYKITEKFILVICFIAIVAISFGIIVINKHVFKCLNKLEKL
jgi:Mn2+/Fe2+ NRAMP family transporter